MSFQPTLIRQNNAVFLNFWIHANVMKLHVIWRSSIRYLLLSWSGNINKLSIPSSSPRRFHTNKNCRFIKTFENRNHIYERISNVCIHEIPSYILWRRGPIYHIIEYGHLDHTYNGILVSQRCHNKEIGMYT